MADEPIPVAREADPPSRPGTGRRIARVVSVVALVALLVTALVLAAVRWLDTDSGRAFVVRHLDLFQPANGLTLAADRIDGSIFGQATVHGLRIGDPKGVFATSPRVDFDWRPLDFLQNRLTFKSFTTREMRLLRRPELIDDGRILPDFDITIDRLRIDRLILAPAVAGAERTLSVGGSIDIRSGLAKADLGVISVATPGQPGSGDTLRLKLVAEPDRDVFDLEALVHAPRGGAITGVLGLSQPLDATLTGDGSWTTWQGKLDARLDRKPLADVALSARSGLFTARGNAWHGLLLEGPAAALVAPALAINGSARLADGTADIDVKLGSKALAVEAKGGLDFSEEAIRNVVVNARLLDPRVLNPQLAGRDVRLAARVAGSFSEPLIDYRVTAASLGFGEISATDVRVSGIVRAGSGPLTVPVSLAIARVTGLNEMATPLLTNIRLDGPLTWNAGVLSSNDLRFRSDRLSGNATLRFVPGDRPDYRIAVKGSLPRYTVDGVGAGDITADLTIVPGPNGSRITGRAAVRTTRLENQGLLDFIGGLPLLSTDFSLADDLAFEFRNARFTAPDLNLTANGSRSANGVLRVNASGTSSALGPLTIAIAGPTETPTIDIGLAKPGFGIGLADVIARVAPASGGWSFDARATSDYGPLSGKGLIRTATTPLSVDVDRLSFAGIEGRGTVSRTEAGPFAGKLLLAGPGLDGSVTLSAAGEVQRADVTATANAATLSLDVPVTITSGTLKLTVLLPETGPSATGSFDAAGITRDDARIDKASGTLGYADGRGTAKVAISGNAGLPFALTADASIAPDRITLSADGRLDQTPIKLSGPAIFTRTPEGWALAPVSVVTSEGGAELSGLFGDSNALKARFDRVSLSLLAIAWPSLNLDGRLSGTVNLAMSPGSVPSGTAALRVNGLSRSSLTSASPPIDVGINADLGTAGITARAVVVRNGAVEGRAQVHIGPIPAGPETLTERLFASPVMAQARYNGPAQVLVGLTGVSGLDVRGPVTVAADVSGVLGDPRIAGTARSEGSRIELVALGTVIDQISLDSRFTASRLEIINFTGRAGRDGSLTATGGVDLSAARGFPVDVRMQMKNAQLVNRDDLTATTSGNVRIATDEYGGVVSGKLNIERATYRIGRTSVAEVPVLLVTEKNAQALGRRVQAYVPPTRWLLNLEVRGDRRLFVQGMGITSEWSADVRVKGTATAPEVTGRVQLVRGDYDFAGRRFSLTKGDVRFQGQFPPDPIIDIVAESSANGFTAQLSITGTAQKPEIKFSSVPALPEDEVLSRILFGESVTNLSAPEAIQLAAALASLRPTSGKGFNPIGAVRKGLGIDRLRILPADTVTGRKTSIAAGQYIGRNVYVELATDAQGFTATNIEVSLTRSLSVLSQVATLGGMSVSLKWKRDY
jgi:translocation and assembly module TamB